MARTLAILAVTPTILLSLTGCESEEAGAKVSENEEIVTMDAEHGCEGVVSPGDGTYLSDSVMEAPAQWLPGEHPFIFEETSLTSIRLEILPTGETRRIDALNCNEGSSCPLSCRTRIEHRAELVFSVDSHESEMRFEHWAGAVEDRDTTIITLHVDSLGDLVSGADQPSAEAGWTIEGFSLELERIGSAPARGRLRAMLQEPEGAPWSRAVLIWPPAG